MGTHHPHRCGKSRTWVANRHSFCTVEAATAFIIGNEPQVTLVLPGASLVVAIFLPKARQKGPKRAPYRKALPPYASEIAF